MGLDGKKRDSSLYTRTHLLQFCCCFSQLHSFSPPFVRAIDLLIRFVDISETRWAYPYRVGGNPGDPGVGFFGVAPAAFSCWFAAFSAGETQIWPGDLRVVAVLSGLCLFCFLHGSASFYEA